MPLRCFIQEQAPIPGTAAQPVRYPACEWVGDEGEVDLQHPFNRFVCSWLSSDVNSVERCQEVLDAMAQIESGQRAQWFADGDAFCVDFSAAGVQFNFSHVETEDRGWWGLPEGCFVLGQIHGALAAWCKFLSTFNTI